VNLRSATARRRAPVSVVGRWLLLLAALGGLLAMHGLSDHGIGAAVAVPSSGVAAPVTAMSPGTHDARSHPGTHDGTEAVPSRETSGGASGHHRGGQHSELVVGMCLAVLAAGLLLGVAAWRTCRFVRLRHATSAQALAAAAALWVRAHGPAPPDLRVLSIQRC
jgi:hypothetical protein